MRRFISGTALAAVLALGAGPALVHAADGAPKDLILAQASMEPDANADADAPDLNEAPSGPGPSASGQTDKATGHTSGEATAGEVYDYKPHELGQDTGKKIGAEQDGATGSSSGASGASGTP
jgi:hypothetical protein